ncbi:MAG: hydrolase [Thermoanaerobaculia bacterium]
MLIDAEKSCLLVVDVQERLLPAIHESDRVVRNIGWLMQIAGELGVPILMSEQYPRGLGHTVAELRDLVPAEEIVEKIHFSCAASPECRRRLDVIGRQQIVVTGIEAHVCVLQTALGLLEDGFEVYAVADAVSSRRAAAAELAVERLRRDGVRVVGREMVAFEWLHQAGTDRFRDISKRFLR